MFHRKKPQRVAIVAETYLPDINGVANSVMKVSAELEAMGKEVLIVAPGEPWVATPTVRKQRRLSGDERNVVRVPSIVIPGSHQLAVGATTTKTVRRELEKFRPDVIHVASPFALGHAGLKAARAMGVPSVAIFQTDVAGFARKYGMNAEATIWSWLHHVHENADRTLAPSRATITDLENRRFARVHHWGRGVDLKQFDPGNRDAALHDKLAGGKTLVGYVGRLAPEKCVDQLKRLNKLDNVQLAVVGDGPSRVALEEMLPNAHFTGLLRGAELARVVASLDIFVHTGPNETFCQTIQEAMASGVPVVAPASGGPLDLVQHKRNGLLFTPGDKHSLRTAISALVDSPELRSSLRNEALHDVAGRTWAALTEQLVTHYEELMPSRPMQHFSLSPLELALPG